MQCKTFMCHVRTKKNFLVSLTLMILVGTVFDLAIFERDAFYFFFLEP